MYRAFGEHPPNTTIRHGGVPANSWQLWPDSPPVQTARSPPREDKGCSVGKERQRRWWCRWWQRWWCWRQRRRRYVAAAEAVPQPRSVATAAIRILAFFLPEVSNIFQLAIGSYRLLGSTVTLARYCTYFDLPNVQQWWELLLWPGMPRHGRLLHRL